MSDEFDNFRAPTFEAGTEMNHRAPKERGNYPMGFCMRRLDSEKFSACKNQRRTDAKGCALCIRFSNYK